MDFWTSITFQENNSEIISKIYSPDFDSVLYDLDEMADLEQPLILNDISAFINDKLIQLIKAKNGFIIPKTYKQLGIDFTNKQQFWIYNEVDFSPSLGLCARVIPFTGKAATILSISTEMLITFMELRIASSKETEDIPMQVYLTSLFSVIFNASIALILYTKTDVLKSLQSVGHEIDNAVYNCFRQDRINATDSENERTGHASKCLAISALSCVILNSAINFTAEKQGLILVAKNFIELEPHLGSTEQEMIFIAVYMNLITSLYSTITFQGSFAIKSVEELHGFQSFTSNIQKKCSTLLFNFKKCSAANEHSEIVQQEDQVETERALLNRQYRY